MKIKQIWFKDICKKEKAEFSQKDLHHVDRVSSSKHGVKIWANFRKILRLVTVVDMQLVQAFFLKNLGVHHHDVM